MARRKIRTSQCDNCGYSFREGENYCPSCGQENHHPNQPIKHLILEFFESLFHFDTKVFLSLKYLFLKPGQMTREFLDNKRARFVPPMRLYIFISFIFFLLVGKTVQNEDKAIIQINQPTKDGRIHISAPGDQQHEEEDPDLTSKQDSIVRDSSLKEEETMPKESAEDDLDTLDFWTLNYPYRNSELQQFKGRELDHLLLDSLLLSNGQEISFFNRQVLKNFIRGKLGDRSFDQNVRKGFIKYISILMFVLMPVFAFILYLLHIRSGRNYYEYLIYSVHIHTALFTFLSCVMLLGLFMETNLPLKLVMIGMLIYFVVSLKFSFGQSYGKVILKSIIIGFSYLLTLAVCLVIALGLGALMA